MLINNDTIIKDSNPLVREKSLEVPLPLSKEDEDLLLDMLTYVKESTDEEIAKEKNLSPAVGISAIQVGVKKKMMAIVIKDNDGNIKYQYALVNPKLISYSLEKAYLKYGEGCLSVPEAHEGYVYRPARIKVRAYDALEKKLVDIKVKDYLALVFQHEMDHFDGVLYYDHINKDNPFYEDPNAVVIE
ncbi:MAG: peptide deformylase [Erysipelotrichaceae bacterium]|nr:peptide deformylase [Erysipelotrichaceae bacterium]